MSVRHTFPLLRLAALCRAIRTRLPQAGTALVLVLLMQAILPGLLSFSSVFGNAHGLSRANASTAQIFVELCTRNGLQLVAIDAPDTSTSTSTGDAAHDAPSDSAPHDMSGAHCPLCLIAGDTPQSVQLTVDAAAYYLVFTPPLPAWVEPTAPVRAPYLHPDTRGSPALG